jgi:predicted nucleic acid-binding Zn finger protein
MDVREQRGLALAAAKRFRQKGDLWLVPSANGNGTYVVDPRDRSCSCPDFETRGQKCKHVYAAEITLKRETVTAPDGTVTLSQAVERGDRVLHDPR